MNVERTALVRSSSEAYRAVVAVEVGAQAYIEPSALVFVRPAGPPEPGEVIITFNNTVERYEANVPPDFRAGEGPFRVDRQPLDPQCLHQFNGQKLSFAARRAAKVSCGAEPPQRACMSSLSARRNGLVAWLAKFIAMWVTG